MPSLQFPSSITAPSAESRRHRLRKYFEHLGRQGFVTDHPLYRFFAAEVFHDSPLMRPSFSFARGEITLRLRNVFAIDKVGTETSAKSIRPPATVRRDFSTQIIFRGVRTMSLPVPPAGTGLKYVACNVFRIASHYRIDILARGANPSETVIFRIHFGEVTVEDIAPKIAKYIAPAKDPAEYMAHARPKRGCTGGR